MVGLRRTTLVVVGYLGGYVLGSVNADVMSIWIAGVVLAMASLVDAKRGGGSAWSA